MKTVVFGVFNEVSDARRVLDQIVQSPLDLDTVSVVHEDPAVQDALATAVGLPRRHTLATGIVLGGLVGALVGGFAGSGVLAFLGPLLAAGLGALAGGALGGVASTVIDATRVPEPLADEILEALSEGATVVSVRTANMPTARAIRDLFEAGGSRSLHGPIEGGQPQAPSFGMESSVPGASAWPDAGAGPPGMEAGRGPDHDLFAPPWRRTPFAAGPRKGVQLESEAESWSAEERADAERPTGSVPSTIDGGRGGRPEALVTVLALSPRVVRALQDAGIQTRRQLIVLASGGEAALLALPGIGPGAVEEILAAIDDGPGHASV